jgi:hypothetical protein
MANARGSTAFAPSRLARAERLLRRARVRGFRRTLRALVQAYVCSLRRWYIFYRPIAAPRPPPSESGFECRQASAADVESLRVFEPNRQRREFRAWLAEGAFLFAAFKDGEPVAFQCFSREVPKGPPLSSLALEPGQVWTVDVQTLPEFRRHRVAAELRAYRDDFFRARGVREYVSSVQDDNLPTLRYAYGNEGQRLVERVELLSYVCLLGFRRIRVEKDALARLERQLARAERADRGATRPAR